MKSLEDRHLSNLRFAEVSRALRALSSAYVERRGRLAEGGALIGAGKRAAFAMFYGPLHFLLLRAIAGSLPGACEGLSTVVDLGCGTGAAGSGWAASCAGRIELVGVDRSAWALGEARATYREFGLRARLVQHDINDAAFPKSPAAFLAAFAINELDDGSRERLMTRLLDRARRGDGVLVVEPLARAVAPWWNRWTDRVVAAGGRADEWRFRIERPAIVEKLDRAAGLDHREITGRSLWVRHG